MSGWGAVTRSGDNYPEVLQKVRKKTTFDFPLEMTDDFCFQADVPKLSYDECKGFPIFRFEPITHSQFCAGYAKGKIDACGVNSFKDYVEITRPDCTLYRVRLAKSLDCEYDYTNAFFFTY